MTRLFEKTLHGPQDLDAFIADLEKHFEPRTVLLLEGEMGSGKTETVRALARRRGWKDVASPSFGLHHRYGTQDDGADHLDLFRIENEDELESTGFWDLFSEDRGLILVEWADRLKIEMLPRDWLTLRLRFTKGAAPTERHIVVEKV